MRWSWHVDAHAVVVDWSFWTGTRRLAVDGTAQPLPGGILTPRIEVPLTLGDAAATLTFRLRLFTIATCALVVAGRPIEPTDAPADFPPWAWLFVAANAAILVATRGGALWGALAGIGVVACLGAARLRRPPVTRALALATITAACWGAYALIRDQLF